MKKNVVYKGGYVWRGNPSEHGIDEGDRSQIQRTGENILSLGMEKVELVEHLDE